MTLATVRGAAEHAAKQGKLTPHQLAALSALDEALTDQQRQLFSEAWRSEGSPAKLADPLWLKPALKIIKEFEGLRLDAYRCPAGVPTIGYGATRMIDKPVRMGDKITAEFAEDLLINQVENLFAPGLFALLPMAKTWKPDQQAALVSWAFNVGLGAVEDSTLRKRLLAKEPPATVVAEELPRWNRGDGGKVLEGLKRRRAAEVALFTGDAAAPVPAVRFTPGASFSFKVTPHVTYGELALNQESRRFTAQHQCDTALELCQFIEKARAAFGGKPAIITSGYRPPAVNKAVGGASRSEHLYDAPGVGAVDFYLEGVPTKELQDWADRAWPYSLGYGAPKGFIHIGKRKGSPRVRWDY
jgi:GH24 family phage-related lysozyme (muramidase)